MHIGKESKDSIEKSSNKNYISDIENAVQYTRWLLELLGVWPMVTKKSSKNRQFFSVFLIIFCNISMAFTLVPTTLHMIFREKNTIVKVMQTGPIGMCFTSMLKYGLIVSHCKAIKLCMEHMETDWMTIESVNEREIMMKSARVGRGLTVTCGLFMYAGGLSYHLIMPMLKGTTINQFNETIRPIVYPGFEIFVEAQKSPNYEIVFWGTCLSGFVRYTVTITACSLAAVFVTHACGQIQIVMSRLENLVGDIDDTRNRYALQKRMASVIHRHVRGVTLSARIEEILRQICLIELVASSIVICLLEYYCMMKWSSSETLALITYIILLISYSFNIFIFCQIGEILQEQYHEVGTTSYMIEWYRLPGKSGLALVMIIAMANIPRKLTAGQMMDLSVSTFGAIMKTSFVYLNMLRTLAEQ